MGSASNLVRRAAAIVDADGADDAVTAFAVRYQEDDVPLRPGLYRLRFTYRGNSFVFEGEDREDLRVLR